MSDVEEDEGNRILTTKEKWILAILLGILAIICFGPLSFAFSNRIGSRIGICTTSGSHYTSLGLALHLAVFIILVRVLMR